MRAEVSNTNQFPKPYVMAGAGKLTATIWKSGDERVGWHYRFNVFRCDASTGEVNQQLRPEDIGDLVKLARVLSQVVVDDGCIPHDLREELERLSTELDLLWNDRE